MYCGEFHEAYKDSSPPPALDSFSPHRLLTSCLWQRRRLRVAVASYSLLFDFLPLSDVVLCLHGPGGLSRSFLLLRERTIDFECLLRAHKQRPSDKLCSRILSRKYVAVLWCMVSTDYSSLRRELTFFAGGIQFYQTEHHSRQREGPSLPLRVQCESFQIELVPDIRILTPLKNSTSLTFPFKGTSVEVHGLMDTQGALVTLQLDDQFVALNTSTGLRGQSLVPTILHTFDNLDANTTHTLTLQWAATGSTAGDGLLSFAYLDHLLVGNYRAV